MITELITELKRFATTLARLVWCWTVLLCVGNVMSTGGCAGHAVVESDKPCRADGDLPVGVACATNADCPAVSPPECHEAECGGVCRWHPTEACQACEDP